MGKAKIENGERKVPTLDIEGGAVGDCGEAPAHGDVLGGCRRGAIAGLFSTFYLEIEAMTSRHTMSVQN
jgi:hypothetical protein